jgi:hypothetical protein
VHLFALFPHKLSHGREASALAMPEILVESAAIMNGSRTLQPEPGLVRNLEEASAAYLQAELEAFCEVYVESLRFPKKLKEGMRENMRRTARAKGLQFYLGKVRGEPASVSILRIAGKSGYLSMAGTLPKFRGKGLQTAMIHKRVEDARRAGCLIVSASAKPSSPSCRNLKKAGLHVLHLQQTYSLQASSG